MYGDEIANKTVISLAKKYKAMEGNTSMVASMNVGKSGFFSPEYFVNVVVSSTKKDRHRQSMSPRFLKYLSESVEPIHLLYGNKHFEGKDPVSYKTEKFYDEKEGKLLAKVYLDKSHSKFKEVWDSIKQKTFKKTSIEMENILFDRSSNQIIDANVLGFRIVKQGANPDSIILGNV